MREDRVPPALPDPRLNASDEHPARDQTATHALPKGIELARVAACYLDLQTRAAKATETLSILLESNPTRYRNVRGKLSEASEPLRLLAAAQASHDPILRAIMTEKFRSASEFQSALEVLATIGMSDDELARLTTAEDVVAAMATHETEFQDRFEEASRSLGIPPPISQLLVDSAGAGWLKVNVAEYMRKQGFAYAAQTAEFVPGSDGAAAYDARDTFFSIGATTR